MQLMKGVQMMNKNKLLRRMIVCLLTVLMLVSTLASCTSPQTPPSQPADGGSTQATQDDPGSGDTPQAGGDDGLTTDIVWAHFPWGFRGPYETDVEWKDAMIAGFQATYPDVNITVEDIPWDNWQANIGAGIAAGMPPDLFAFGSWLALDYQDNLEPIDDWLGADLDDFAAAALDAGTFDGNAYAWPWFNQGVNLVVNLDMANEFGVQLPTNPEGDWSMDEFLAACEVYKQNGVYAFPLHALDAPINWAMMSIIGNFGGDIFDAERKWANMDTPESLKALEWMLEMQDDLQYSPPGGAALDNFQAFEMFLLGELGMSINPGGMVAVGIADAVADGRIPEPFDVVHVQFPTVEGRNTTTTRIGPTGFVVFKQQNDAVNRREAAMQFCKFLTSADQQKFAAENGLHVPVRKSLADLYEVYPNFISASRGRVFFNAQVEETVYLEDVMNLFQSVLSHSRTPAEALANFDDVVNEKMQRIYDAG